MRDAARQVADGLHLLCATELFLEPLSVRDVAGHHEPCGSSLEGEVARLDLHPDDRAVLLPVTPHVAVVPPGCARDVLAQGIHVLCGTDVGERQARELASIVAVVLHRRLVDREERERADVVNPHRQRAGLEEHPVSSLGILRSFLGAPRGVSPLLFAKLSLDRGHQSRQPPLHDEVARPSAKRRYGGFLPDGARHDDDWHVQPVLSDEGERPGRIERRHRVVRDDEIPCPAPKRDSHGLAGVDALEGEVEAAAAPQLAHDKLRITLRILDQEKAKHSRQWSPLAIAPSRRAGRSFGRAPYKLSCSTARTRSSSCTGLDERSSSDPLGRRRSQTSSGAE